MHLVPVLGVNGHYLSETVHNTNSNQGIYEAKLFRTLFCYDVKNRIPEH